jgi:hypothetical protein
MWDSTQYVCVNFFLIELDRLMSKRITITRARVSVKLVTVGVFSITESKKLVVSI